MHTTLSKSLFLLLLIVFCRCSTTAQTPEQTAQKGDVVVISTKLVQLDAIATDKNGKQVTDLNLSDFEVLQDGKPQTITHFSYVSLESLGRPIKRPTVTGKDFPLTTTSSSTGRLLTFIVDDGNCSLSTLGISAAKDGLKKFVNEQMLPTDRVAIYKSRAGSSVLQQYTSDRSQLLRTIDKIRWYPPAGSCASSDGSFFEAAKSNILDKTGVKGFESKKIESDDERKIRERAEDANRNNQVNGLIGLINYAVRGLQNAPGRKLVFVLSDGIQIRNRNDQSSSAAESLRDLASLANRASVVINTIDVRGQFSTSMIEARDEVRTAREGEQNNSDLVISDRGSVLRNSLEGMYYLADTTGGKFYKNTNNLDELVKRALAIESGYYLIAYEPAEDTFRSRNENRIEIKVKRPNVSLRSRTVFYGATNLVSKTSKRTGYGELYESIAAPLPAPGLNLQLTAYFGNSPNEGNFVRALVHLQGDEISFIDDRDKKKAVFDVVAVTFNEKNQVLDEFTRKHTFRVQPEAIPSIRQNGLIYTTDIPIKKPGIYNFRVAVRDEFSKVIGSSSQMVEVPGLKKGKLFLSGLVVSQVGTNGKFSIPDRIKTEEALSMTMSGAVPAIRRFHPGSVLAYSYTIYNAQIDKTTDNPKVWTQIRLYRNGELVSEGKIEPAKFEDQSDWTRIRDYGYLRLNTNAEPGEYTLQLILKDLAVSGREAVVSQLIDFEIIP